MIHGADANALLPENHSSDVRTAQGLQGTESDPPAPQITSALWDLVSKVEEQENRRPGLLHWIKGPVPPVLML